MIVTRKMVESDYPKALELIKADGSYPTPNLDNPLYFVKGVALKDDKIVGVGVIRLTAESMMAVDKNLRLRDRAKIVDTLIQDGMVHTYNAGMDEWHVFITGESIEGYCNTLKKRYGFKECEGKSLFLDLGVSRNG